MIRVVLENMGGGIFRINDRLCQKSEYVFELAWPGSDVINISEYHGVLLFGLVHYTEVRLADGTLFTSAQEILDWADTNAFGGGGGGSKGFDTKDDFPIPGADGILYIDKSDDSMWYWDGTEYVQFTSFHPYPTFADFPDPGNPGYIYLDKATGITYYWNGAAYVILSAGPGAFIQNQIALAQAASFWIAGRGIIGPGTDNGAALQVKGGALSLAGNVADYAGVAGALMHRSDLNRIRAFLAGVWKNLATEDQIPAIPDAILNQIAVWQQAGFKIAGGASIKVNSGSGGGTSFGVFRYDDVPLFIVRDLGQSSLTGNLLIGGTGRANVPLEITGNGGGVPAVANGFAFTWNNSSGGGESNFIWCSNPASLAAYLSIDFYNSAAGTVTNKVRIHPNGDVQLMQGVLALFAGTSDNAVVNGALMFRTDIQKFRAGVNGAWQNLATEGAAYLSGNAISVDQLCVSATDMRTGLSKYSQSVPFKTINAAIGAASDGDVVHVLPGNYTEEVILDPRGYSGWLTMQIRLDSVTINGSIKAISINNAYTAVYAVGPGRSVINGQISGLNEFKLNYFANLIVRDGVYGMSNPDTAFENCDITCIQPVTRFYLGSFRNSKLTCQAYPGDYTFSGTIKFNNCEVNFASAAFTYNQYGGDLIFENCRVKAVGALLQNDDRGGMRILIRNSRISFAGWIANAGNTNPFSLVIHDSQIIGATPGTDVILNPSGGVQAHFELIGTVRNCATGAVPTVAANDVQAPSITEF